MPSWAFTRRTLEPTSCAEETAASGHTSAASTQRYLNKIRIRMILLALVCQKEHVAGLAVPNVPPNDNLAVRTGEFSLFVRVANLHRKCRFQTLEQIYERNPKRGPARRTPLGGEPSGNRRPLPCQFPKRF